MNKRVVATGAAMIVLAVAFFLYMQIEFAPRSNDRVAMMQTVSEVSGAVGVIGLAMAIYGLVKRRR